MPRGKRAEQAITQENPLASESDEQLIQKYVQLDDWVEAEAKRFSDHLQPCKAQAEAIKNEFLRRLTERKADSTKTDCGTAYLSRVMNVAVGPEGRQYIREDGSISEGREALLDFALDNWEAIGSDLLMISAQKDAVKRWMEEKGVPPPGLKITPVIRVNIRRS